jgi:secreted trypsin-like serine protease
MPLKIVVKRKGSSKVFFVHQKYSVITIANDIALVKLPISVVTSEAVKPINLYRGNDQFVDTILTASGYGLDESNQLPQLLQFTDVVGISRTECSSVYGFMITDNILCTFGHPDRDRGICSGDSGGPLITKDAIPLQVGVVSFGSSASCTDGKPQGFTRVSSYISWIETTMLK